CLYGDVGAPHTAVVLGDSIGMQWFPAFQDIFARPGWRLIALTKSSCPMVDQEYFSERLGVVYRECTQWRAAVLGMLARMRPDARFLSPECRGAVDPGLAVFTSYLRQAVQSAPNAALLDLTDLACPAGSCEARAASGLVVFRDNQHLTATFVRAQADAIRARL